MRAAVLKKFGEPLEVDTIPDPLPRHGEITVQVRAAGLCGTDLKLVSGNLPGVELPLIPGHEIAGEVVDDPEGTFAPGQRVACYFYESCGECKFCLQGRNTICRSVVRLGIERDGGLAEFVTLPHKNAIPLPDRVRFDVAAVAMDSVVTPWRALVDRAQIGADDFVAIVGGGGLGLNGVQIARDVGAHVAVIEPGQEARAKASDLGAELCVSPDSLGEVVDWSGGGADVALESSGVPDGFAAAVNALRPGGCLVVCGYQPGVPYAFDSARLPLDEITILGSRAGSRANAVAAVDAVARGAVRPTVSEVIPLTAVNEGLGRLRSREVTGRLVINPAA